MRSWLPRTAAGVAGTGLLLVVAGTFLAWSRSGSVLRNSYESIAVVRRLNLLHGGFAQLLVDGWVLVAPATALPVACYALGARRTATISTSVLSIMTGTISGVAFVQGGDEDTVVGLAGQGPGVTLLGSALALAGAVVVLVTERGGTNRPTGGAP